MHLLSLLSLVSMSLLLSSPCEAGRLGLFGHKSSGLISVTNVSTEQFGSREVYVYAPPLLPPTGSRALVVVLHGGMGNAERIVTERSEKGMNLNAVAEKYGFIVAYMNGTPVTKFLGNDKKGWNAGECCGQSAESKTDDVRYITGAVRYLSDKYGIDERRVYGLGHSNGAMMTQRVICETGLFAAGVSISGALEIETGSCHGAQGKKILEIHGGKDTSVPIAGGMGEGISNKYPKRSQDYSKRTFEISGAQYILQVYPEAAHKLETIESAVEKTDGTTLPEKAAAFFGLAH